jgi:hypothetical protein
MRRVNQPWNHTGGCGEPGRGGGCGSATGGGGQGTQTGRGECNAGRAGVGCVMMRSCFQPSLTSEQRAWLRIRVSSSKWRRGLPTCLPTYLAGWLAGGLACAIGWRCRRAQLLPARRVARRRRDTAATRIARRARLWLRLRAADASWSQRSSSYSPREVSAPAPS